MSAEDCLKSLQSVINSTSFTDLHDKLYELGKTVDRTVDDFHNGICALDDSRIDTTSLARGALHNLRSATSNAFYIAWKINEFMWYVQDAEKMAKVTAGVRSGSFQELKLLLHQLSTCLAQAGEYHVIFVESCDKAKKQCLSGAEACASKSREARLRKRKVQMKGGAVAGAGLGVAAVVAVAGTVTSVLAGVFTAGIGTAVGLGVTAGVTATTLGAVGTTAAVATAVAASEYDKVAEKFRQLGTTFDMASLSAEELSAIVSDFKYLVDSVASQVSTVQWCVTEGTLENICTVLNELSTKCRTIYCSTSSVTCDKLQTILQERLEMNVTYYDN